MSNEIIKNLKDCANEGYIVFEYNEEARRTDVTIIIYNVTTLKLLILIQDKIQYNVIFQSI